MSDKPNPPPLCTFFIVSTRLGLAARSYFSAANTQQTSSKFLPVEAGYVSASLRILSGLITYTLRTVMGSPSALVWSGCSMPKEAAMLPFH